MKNKRSVSRTSRVVIDRVLGDALKKEGMSAAERAADLAWRRRAQKAILKVARAKMRFTADDVWKTGLDRPREPRALGPEMNSAEISGIIVSTDDFKLTHQASRHRAPVRVWQSLVFGTKRNPNACEGCGRLADLYGGLCAKCDAKVAKDPSAARRVTRRMKAHDAADTKRRAAPVKKRAAAKKATARKKSARSSRVAHKTKKKVKK